MFHCIRVALRAVLLHVNNSEVVDFSVIMTEFENKPHSATGDLCKKPSRAAKNALAGSVRLEIGNSGGTAEQNCADLTRATGCGGEGEGPPHSLQPPRPTATLQSPALPHCGGPRLPDPIPIDLAQFCAPNSDLPPIRRSIVFPVPLSSGIFRIPLFLIELKTTSTEHSKLFLTKQ
ncbi:hypothetical protein J6590_025080 [Homalodisca vitripennis]|nr:hypothetical protein J6590_025080 [Homalodisca vitripennis]